MEKGILLIETYPMDGSLFGAEMIELWSQIVDDKSYKFSNPLYRINISRQNNSNVSTEYLDFLSSYL